MPNRGRDKHTFQLDRKAVLESTAFLCLCEILVFQFCESSAKKKLTYLEYYVIIKPVRTKSQESESYGSI